MYGCSAHSTALSRLKLTARAAAASTSALLWRPPSRKVRLADYYTIRGRGDIAILGDFCEVPGGCLASFDANAGPYVSDGKHKIVHENSVARADAEK